VTGEFQFSGYRIPIDFILTAVYIRGGNIQKLTIDEFWEIIEIYEAYEQNSTSVQSSQGISRNEVITLQYIITYLQTHEGSTTGEIVFHGEKISVTYILSQLRQYHIDIRYVTTEEIYRIINTNVSEVTTTATHEHLGKHPTRKQITEMKFIIEFLKTQGSESTGTFTIGGYRISIQFVLTYLNQKGTRIQNMTYEELWSIILIYVNNGTQSTTELRDSSSGLISTSQLTTETTTNGGSSNPHGTEPTGSGTATETTTNGGSSNPHGTEPTGSRLNDTLFNILQILLTQRENASGVIQFNGYSISLQFILTVLSIERINIRNATTDDIYDVLLLYTQFENSTTPAEVSDVPEGEIVSLLFILQYLKTEGQGNNDNFSFDGHQIPVRFVIEILRLQNISVQTLTISELYSILQLYTGNGADRSVLSLADIVSLGDVRQILEAQGSNASGAVLIHGFFVSFDFIVRLLNIQRTDIQNSSIQELWLIVQLSIEFQKRLNVSDLDNQEQAFLDMLSNPDEVRSSVLVAHGQVIHLQEIVSFLGLRLDNSTGKYDTGNITGHTLFEAILNIINSKQNSTGTSGASSEEALYKVFMNIISNPDNIRNSLLVVNGYSVPVEDIVNALGLQINNSTGKYDTQNVTVDILFETVLKLIRDSQDSSATGDGKEAVLQYFLDIISNPDNVHDSILMYNGQKIRVQDIVNALGLHIDNSTGKYDTKNLTAEELYETLQNLVNTQQTTTAAT
jgi:uncharacterized protein (DUF433 family)